MLNGTKWLLIAEINNEADGGESPATVLSALESGVRQWGASAARTSAELEGHP